MSIASNIEKIINTLPPHVKLVAVSKFHPVASIKEAYKTGQRIFGESREQELTTKQAELPKDIEWHFIGHLQSNKVKSIIPYIHTIQSVDSWKLLKEIDNQAINANKVVNCLLEIHIGKEESKYGLSIDSCRALLDQKEVVNLKHIRITGLMGIATFTDDLLQIRQEFNQLHTFFEELKKTYFANEPTFCELSMGMSNDYLIAISEGSTIIRVGSSIFGERG